MGRWDAKCELSNLGIKKGQQIVAVPVAKGPRLPSDSFVDQSYNAFPVGPHVFGTYDDYGGIELSEGEASMLAPLTTHSDSVILACPFETRDIHRENLRGLGYENPHEVDPYMTGAEKTLAVQVGSDEDGRIAFPKWMFIRREIYDFVMGLEDSPDQLQLRYVGGVLTPVVSRDFRTSLSVTGLLPPPTPYHDSDDATFTRLAELCHLERCMGSLGLGWKVSYTGPQDHTREPVAIFCEFILHIIEGEGQRNSEGQRNFKMVGPSPKLLEAVQRAIEASEEGSASDAVQEILGILEEALE